MIHEGFCDLNDYDDVDNVDMCLLDPLSNSDHKTLASQQWAQKKDKQKTRKNTRLFLFNWKDVRGELTMKNIGKIAVGRQSIPFGILG